MPDPGMDNEMLIDAIRPVILSMHDHIRDRVVAAFEGADVQSLSKAVAQEGGDTIYAIDRVGEDPLIHYLGEFARNVAPVVLITEGQHQGATVLPRGTSETDARLRVIIDPIDGTRGLMYQKRSPWILTGVAPNRGDLTNLQDLELSVMTEIPLLKQHLSDQVWARKGRGVMATRHNRLDMTSSTFELAPSRAPGISHGFATLARMVPGARDVLAAVEEDLIIRVAGPQPEGVAICFEDQYISTGGQMYELCAGHDRLIADLRSLTKEITANRGRAPGLCCHPYDLAGLVVAVEVGVIVTGPNGGPLDAPLDTDTDVSWIGYANEAIRTAVEPHLLQLLQEYGLKDVQSDA
ncbi:MAG TPA: hypothetical protein VMO47_13200 [Rhodothermales bacterium]|nr:hypothetical protein [Rhodothermales bacterium]